VLGKVVRQIRQPVTLLVVGTGVLLSGCAIGFRVPATDITATSATLNGYVGSNRSEQGEWFFKYGTTEDFGSETPHRSIQFTELTRHDVSEPVSGLEPRTVYHYVLCADDQEPGVDAFCSAPQTLRTFDDATSDSVVVTGGRAGQLTNTEINVTSGPAGENPTGQLAADSPYGHLVASGITCFSVSANRANIGGTLQPNASGSTAFRVTVVDGTLQDDLGGRLEGSVGPTDCSVAIPVDRLVEGNAVVIDAPAP
jgi:hypothetical protein